MENLNLCNNRYPRLQLSIERFRNIRQVFHTGPLTYAYIDTGVPSSSPLEWGCLYMECFHSHILPVFGTDYSNGIF